MEVSVASPMIIPSAPAHRSTNLYLSDDTTGDRAENPAICRQTKPSSYPLRLASQAEPNRLVRVKRVATERESPVPARPLAGVPIPGQLDPVEIRIVQVDGLVGAVIGRPVDRPAMIEQAFERDGQISALRIVDGEVVQARRAGGGGQSVLALPGVKADVVVVAAGGEEGGAAEVE